MNPDDREPTRPPADQISSQETDPWLWRAYPEPSTAPEPVGAGAPPPGEAEAVEVGAAPDHPGDEVTEVPGASGPEAVPEPETSSEPSEAGGAGVAEAPAPAAAADSGKRDAPPAGPRSPSPEQPAEPADDAAEPVEAEELVAAAPAEPEAPAPPSEQTCSETEEPDDAEVADQAAGATGWPTRAEERAEPVEAEAFAPADWSERVRLLDAVELERPADEREALDVWEVGGTQEVPPPEELAQAEAEPEPEPETEAEPAGKAASLSPSAPPGPAGEITEQIQPVRAVGPVARSEDAAPPAPAPPGRQLEPPPALAPVARPVERPPGWPPPAPPSPLWERPQARAAPPPGWVRPSQIPPGATRPPSGAPPAIPPPPARGTGWEAPGGDRAPWERQPVRVPAQPRARARRRGWIIVLAIALALLVISVQLVQLGLPRRPDPAASRGAGTRSAGTAADPGASAAPLSPQAQVTRLLDGRAKALLRHDKAGFLATVDRRRPSFYRSQAALFDRMATVPFTTFSYTVPDPLQDVGSDRARRRYSPTVVSIFPVEASFGFRGQDSSPFLARYYYTFAITDAGWRIAGQDDVPSPLRSDVEIWDGGRVQTVSTARTLVVFHPGDAGLARRLLSVAEHGYAQVAASWSQRWDRKVVILVPRDQREAQRLVSSRNLSDVAAVTSSAVEAGPLHRLLGNRIIVNTSLIRGYRTLDLQVVLTHEMTHVATRGVGVGVPLYLVEGFADYTALRPLDAPVRVTHQSLALAVRAGRFSGRLPSRDQLTGGDAALAYDESSTFCLWVQTIFGEGKLQALYRSFGDLGNEATRQEENLRFRRVLGVSRAVAERRWAGFVRGAV